MEMIPLKSSNIKFAGRNKLTNTLRVQFSNGTEYDYADVDAEMFNSFMEAESQGKFFHRNIKGIKTGTKVEGEEDG